MHDVQEGKVYLSLRPTRHLFELTAVRPLLLATRRC